MGGAAIIVNQNKRKQEPATNGTHNQHELNGTGGLGEPVWPTYVTHDSRSFCLDQEDSTHKLYGYRTDNEKPLVTYRFLNLSSFLDLSPGVFF